MLTILTRLVCQRFIIEEVTYLWAKAILWCQKYLLEYENRRCLQNFNTKILFS